MRQRSQNDNETMKEIKIAVINYPTASQSALYGIVEMLELANTMCEQINADVAFSASIYKAEQLNSNALVDVVILPPSMSETFFEHEYFKSQKEFNSPIGQLFAIRPPPRISLY